MSDVTLQDLLRREADFNLCSCFGHSWALNRPEGLHSLGFRFRMYCQRCGTERLDTLSGIGTLVTRSYTYPEGYLFKKGGRPELSLLRLAVVRQNRKVLKKSRKAS